MFEELDTVVLAHDIEKDGLRRGDVGTIVHIYKNGKILEVEFVNAEGKTVALLTLDSSEVRGIRKNDMLHVRGFATV